jgi:hypothetical protein
MVDERWIIYDGFNDTGKYSVEWVWIIKKFLKLAFAGGHREASCSCSMCENKMMLSEYEMSSHLAKKGFISNYLLWHQHREVQPAVVDESDENNDVDQMDNMVADIRRDYDLESKDPPPEVHNFYKLIAASEEKVHNGTDVNVICAVRKPLPIRFTSQCTRRSLEPTLRRITCITLFLFQFRIQILIHSRVKLSFYRVLIWAQHPWCRGEGLP